MSRRRKNYKRIPDSEFNAKAEALGTIWGWASHHCEEEFNGMCQELDEDVRDGRYTRKQAKAIHIEFKREANRIIKRIVKIRTKQDPEYYNKNQL